MTPHDLARLHGRAMTIPEPWSAATFEGFLNTPGIILETAPSGFALGRVAADEAELLTLAVDPDARRAGMGRACLDAFEATAARQGAVTAFLEVAKTNTAARALYSGAGWQPSGRRTGYYRAPDGTRIDALVLRKALQHD